MTYVQILKKRIAKGDITKPEAIAWLTTYAAMPLCNAKELLK